MKNVLKEAKNSTMVAMIGGVIVGAGSWGSCQFQVAEPVEEAETVEVEKEEESDAPEAKGGEEATPTPEALE